MMRREEWNLKWQWAGHGKRAKGGGVCRMVLAWKLVRGKDDRLLVKKEWGLKGHTLREGTGHSSSFESVRSR